MGAVNRVLIQGGGVGGLTLAAPSGNAESRRTSSRRPARTLFSASG